MLYLIVRAIAIILFKFLFRLQVNGLENIPGKGAFILAVNHTSYLDPPVLAAACPRIVSFLAKEELFENKLFAAFITGLNAFPLKSQSGDMKSLRWAIGILKRGKALIIFPEGRRTPDGKLDKPLSGVGLLAAKAVVPVIPAFIQGANKALPIESKFIRLEQIRVYFGRPIR
ncbi:MAG: 1-acyl-sn-glycerol-3-phosphate acyltransferase, partial [Omnitrophica bacterium]|nr:1-acyl-sn-glycerol-3-phosphate acyltransferase [Candidatus Omnitrophota bacterium]